MNGSTLFSTSDTRAQMAPLNATTLIRLDYINIFRA